MNEMIKRAISVADSFRGMSRQLDINQVSAFGIELETRMARCDEMIEMMRFAKSAATRGVAPCVKSLSYDSKEGCCWITLHDGADTPESLSALREIGNVALRRYDWDHGEPGGTVFSGL